MNTTSNTPRKPSRRRFLTILAAGGAAGAAWKLGLPFRRGVQPVTRRRILMGTVVNLTVVGDDPEAAEASAAATLGRLAELEAQLSRYREDSEVGRLNARGRIGQAGDALLELIKLARSISEIGDGAFDITIQPVLDVYRQALAESQALPSAGAIEDALTLVDYRSIVVNGRSVALGRPGMSVTLDGIGKGYIVDQGVAILRQCGYPNVLVEAGGDLVAAGHKEEMPWRIGIRAPRPGMRLVSVEARDRAVATSGDYLQPFSPDLTQHHIIHPRSGHSSPELASATIVAPTAALADGLATLTMVLGARRSIELLETQPECEGYFIAKDCTVTKTPGLTVNPA